LSFDDTASGAVLLPVFCNVVAYNVGDAPSSLLADFQSDWMKLSGADSIDYKRFFKEYVGFDFAEKAAEYQQQIAKADANLLMKRFTTCVE
jgi:hypothetical protein